MPQTSDPRAHKVVTLFESLQPSDVARLGDYYTAEAYFKDPFNELTGLPGIQRVFNHMFSALTGPRFVVHDVVVQDPQCFMTWEFRFRYAAGQPEHVVRGASHLHFDAHGKISAHRDYWDAAEELYEKLPVIGSLMRWLKRKIQTPSVPRLSGLRSGLRSERPVPPQRD